MGISKTAAAQPICRYFVGCFEAVRFSCSKLYSFPRIPDKCQWIFMTLGNGGWGLGIRGWGIGDRGWGLETRNKEQIRDVFTTRIHFTPNS